MGRGSVHVEEFVGAEDLQCHLAVHLMLKLKKLIQRVEQLPKVYRPQLEAFELSPD